MQDQARKTSTVCREEGASPNLQGVRISHTCMKEFRYRRICWIPLGGDDDV